MVPRTRHSLSSSSAASAVATTAIVASSASAVVASASTAIITSPAARVGAHGRSVGASGVVFGIDDDAAVHALARALGAQVAEVAHGEMDETALARIHRSEGVGIAGPAHPLSSKFRRRTQFVVARLLELLTIEAEFIVLVVFELEQLGGDVLHGAQQLSVALDELCAVRAGELDQQLRMLEISLLGRGLRGDAVFEAESAVHEHLAQEGINLFSSGDAVLNRQSAVPQGG